MNRGSYGYLVRALNELASLTARCGLKHVQSTRARNAAASTSAPSADPPRFWLKKTLKGGFARVPRAGHGSGLENRGGRFSGVHPGGR